MPQKRFRMLYGANKSGLLGEETVARILPNAKRANIPGADFVVGDYYGRGQPHYIEVKSTSADSEQRLPVIMGRRRVRAKKPANSITLKVKNGEWTNRRSHEIVIVTKVGVFFGKSDDLRKYIRENFRGLTRFKNRGKPKKFENVWVPVQKLVDAGIIGGVRHSETRLIATNVRQIEEKKPVQQPAQAKKPKKTLSGFLQSRRPTVIPWQKMVGSQNNLAATKKLPLPLNYYKRGLPRRRQMGLPSGSITPRVPRKK